MRTVSGRDPSQRAAALRCRSRAALLGLLCVLAGGLRSAAAAPTPSVEGALLHRRLPMEGIKRWRGEGWESARLRAARVYVVHLWAVECAPCVEELPLLRRMASGWRTEKDVLFLFVSETLNDQRLLAFWRGQGASGPAVDLFQSVDPELRKTLDSTVQPLTLLVDSCMVVRHALVGSVMQRNEELAEAIRRLLVVLPEDPPCARRRRG